MSEAYPFEHIRAQPQELDKFKKYLPHISKAMPEFFRTTEIAYGSIQQKNIFGNPLGIRQDLGFENALKVLLVACFSDGLFVEDVSATKALDILRTLTLKWYSFGNKLDSCLYFGYFSYSCHSHAVAVLNEHLGQSEFLGGSAARTRLNAPDIANLLVPTHSNAWYKTATGLGDKLHPLWVIDADITTTSLPRPGFQLHFRSTKQFDLRVPAFIEINQVESPVIRNEKVIVSCPQCGQKCRGNLFKQIEVACPNCKTHWMQFTS
jgi:hypothetical protein